MKVKAKFYIIIFIIFTLLYFIIRDINLKNDTINNGQDIIVKFDSVQVLPKRSYYYFSYFSNGKKISTCNSGLKKLFEFNEIKVIPNKFYKAKKSMNDSKMISVNQDEEVVDTTQILNSGFSKQDLMVSKKQ